LTSTNEGKVKAFFTGLFSRIDDTVGLEPITKVPESEPQRPDPEKVKDAAKEKAKKIRLQMRAITKKRLEDAKVKPTKDLRSLHYPGLKEQLDKVDRKKIPNDDPVYAKLSALQGQLDKIKAKADNKPTETEETPAPDRTPNTDVRKKRSDRHGSKKDPEEMTFWDKVEAFFKKVKYLILLAILTITAVRLFGGIAIVPVLGARLAVAIAILWGFRSLAIRHKDLNITAIMTGFILIVCVAYASWQLIDTADGVATNAFWSTYPDHNWLQVLLGVGVSIVGTYLSIRFTFGSYEPWMRWIVVAVIVLATTLTAGGLWQYVLRMIKRGLGLNTPMPPAND
jgi:hypothetical protein